MSKFNKPSAQAPAPRGPVSSVGLIDPRSPSTSLVQRDAKSELFLTAVSSFLTEDTDYESGDKRLARFTELVKTVTLSDPEWVQRFLPWLRDEMNIRTAAIVGLAEYVAAGGPNARSVVARTLTRADEPGELLSYWMVQHGRRIPAGLKRGLADAVERLYNEYSVLRYDSSKAAVSFIDVVNLVHAGGNVALWRYLADSRRHSDPRTEGLPIIEAHRRLLALPESERRQALRDGRVAEAKWSWERLGSWLPGGMDREAWELVIPQMGYMALLRNLRNFDAAGISDEVADRVSARISSADEVAKSRQLPFRFLSAYRHSGIRWHYPLEQALRHSLANVPELSGKTLIMVDCSGSMDDQMSNHGGRRGRPDAQPPTRMDVASLFGAALAIKNPNSTLAAYSTSSAVVKPTRDVLATAQAVTRATNHGGTDTWGTYTNLTSGGRSYDRVVIVTDEQFNVSGRGNLGNHMVYTFNVAGYKGGQLEESAKAVTFGGLTDACFKLIPLIERTRYSKAEWPF